MAAPLRVLVNGQIDGAVSALDRGLHFGDGIFETIRCVAGRPCWWPQHWQRLQGGAGRLALSLPSQQQLLAEVTELAQMSEHCLVKLILTRGPAQARGYAIAGAEVGTRIALCHAWPAAPPLFRVRTARLTLGQNPALAGIKHLNRLEQVLAQRELAAADCEELLLCASSGAVVCGSMSNVFLGLEDALVTPDLEQCGVEGVMRAMVLQAAAALQLPLRIATVTPAMLAAATSVFLTNVRLGLQTAHSVDGRTLRADPRIAPLQSWIDAHAF